MRVYIGAKWTIFDVWWCSMVLMTQKESIMIFGKYLSTFPDVNPRFLPEKAQSEIL